MSIPAPGAARVPFSPPRVLAWEVTRRCPLKCRHCRAAARDVEYGGELSFDECRRVLDTLGGVGMVIWTGGEPMLRGDLRDLVRLASERGVRSVLAPCGAAASEQAFKDLKEAGVSACSFSLDGPDAERHDAFRGVEGAYSMVAAAMSAASSRRMSS